MPSPLRSPRPPSVLLLLAGNPSPLRVCAMTAWILLLAFGAMCTFAMVGAWTSLRALGLSLKRSLPGRAAARRLPRWG